LEDPDFRERWTRTVLADVVARAVLSYRTDRGHSQTRLAKELGVKQPAVSRLEIGEVNPSIETLRRLSSVLGMEFLISIAPTDRPRLLGKEVERASFSERIDSRGSHVVVGVVIPEAPRTEAR
jgi:transcriptional regulator with XRE-family HTH domain